MELVCETDPEDIFGGDEWRWEVEDVYDLLGNMSLKQLQELKSYINEMMGYTDGNDL